MNPPVSSSLRGWRILFFTLEAVLLITFSLSIAERSWHLRVLPQSGVSALLLTIVAGLAWLFLLLVSPFFLRSLRGVALAGWLLAFGLLLYAAFSPAL